MLESMVKWMGFPMYCAYEGAASPPRSSAAHASIYPYGPLPAGDGKTVMLGLQNEGEWAVFCDQLLLPPALAQDSRFASNAQRNAARDVLRRIIVDTFAVLTAAQVVQRLDEAGSANAQVNTLADVWAHAQLRAPGRWTSVDRAASPLPALQPPGRDDARMDAVPAPGQHTQTILAELGLPDDLHLQLQVQGRP